MSSIKQTHSKAVSQSKGSSPADLIAQMNAVLESTQTAVQKMLDQANTADEARTLARKMSEMLTNELDVINNAMRISLIHHSIESKIKSDAAKMFARIVVDKPFTGIDAINAIRAGYPVSVLKSASAYFGVPDTRIQQIAKVPPSTASRLAKANAKIDTAATERIFRMGTVTKMATEVFENDVDAIEWMRQPNKAFG